MITRWWNEIQRKHCINFHEVANAFELFHYNLPTYVLMHNCIHRATPAFVFASVNRCKPKPTSTSRRKEGLFRIMIRSVFAWGSTRRGKFSPSKDEFLGRNLELETHAMCTWEYNYSDSWSAFVGFLGNSNVTVYAWLNCTAVKTLSVHVKDNIALRPFDKNGLRIKFNCSNGSWSDEYVWAFLQRT